MVYKIASRFGYVLAAMAVVVAAALSFTDCQQMDIHSGRVRWAKEIFGLPMLYFYEQSCFADKVELFDMQTDSKAVWVTDSRISPWFTIDNSRNQFYGLVWNCNMACRLMDSNYVSVQGQKTYIAYTLQQLAEKQRSASESFSARDLIDLCGGVISVQEQVVSIPLTADTGNLLEYYIESQYAPLLEENFYHPNRETRSEASLF